MTLWTPVKFLLLFASVRAFNREAFRRCLNRPLLDEGEDYSPAFSTNPLEGGVKCGLGEFYRHELIGVGDVAEIWRGKHTTGVPVAIKLLRQAGDLESMPHFRNEECLLGQLRHEFIPRLYCTAALPDGGIAMMMEFFEGKPLLAFSSMLKEDYRFPVSVLYEAARDANSALSYLHKRNIVFRDVQPENLIYFDDHFRLIDYGDAVVLDEHNRPIGKAPGDMPRATAYLAPEMIAGVAYDTAVDMYQLGVTLVHAALGFNPFEDGIDPYCLTFEHQVAEHISCGLNLTSLSLGPFKRLVAGLLEADPNKRWTHEEVGKWLVANRHLETDKNFI